MTLRNKSVDECREIARKLWKLIESPVILTIKEINEGRLKEVFRFEV